MKTSIPALTLLTLSACANADNLITTNKYFVLDNSGSYPVITEVTKEDACKAKEKPLINGYRPTVWGYAKDECVEGTIHPNAVRLIQEKKLPNPA